ncbi:MAG: hypothetical protein AAFU85_14650 [Planctomycetota bacterium]
MSPDTPPLDSSVVFERESFAKAVSSCFQIHLQESVVDVVLVEVTEHENHARRGAPAPFSILFQLPQGQGIDQGSYLVSHGCMGSMTLFLTPVMPSLSGPRIEAVFN